MADITMCVTTGCPMASECYRKTATPNEVQSYSEFLVTFNNGKAECDYFWGAGKSGLNNGH